MVDKLIRGERESIEEINAIADDGGGCVETWERLSEMHKETTRRSILGKVAGGVL